MTQSFSLRRTGGIWRSNCVRMQDFLVLRFGFYGAAEKKWKKKVSKMTFFLLKRFWRFQGNVIYPSFKIDKDDLTVSMVSMVCRLHAITSLQLQQNLYFLFYFFSWSLIFSPWKMVSIIISLYIAFWMSIYISICHAYIIHQMRRNEFLHFIFV